MNLDNPERLKSLVKSHDWYGEQVHFRKLSISKWRELTEARKLDVADENDEQGGVWWGAKVLSKCLCDPAGVLTFDSDEKRRELEQLASDEMAGLLRVALTWSGLWKEDVEQKKS
jgi:hypothetical protein